MWWQKRLSSCRRHEKDLRMLSDEAPEGFALEALIERAGSRLRDHLLGCEPCRMLLRDSLEGRRLIREAYSPVGDPGITFTRRVMAEIRSLEAQGSRAANLWAAVQTLASRVAWVAALVLLVVSGWLYENRATQPVPVATQETAADRFLEPMPQPANPDEVLVSLAESNP
jgi:hypothetical protein